MIHISAYRNAMRVVSLLLVILIFFIGLWSFFAFSWIYDTSDTSISYTDIVPVEQVYAATEQIIINEYPLENGGRDPRTDELFVNKVNAVKSFYQKYNAPLEANAEDFVRAAELYKIDYRLLPSISIVESSGGKHLFKAYNPFGWGKWGYPSFQVAIYDVARGMSNYYARGADTPREIAPKYNPVTPNEWGSKVEKLMAKMTAL